MVHLLFDKIDFRAHDDRRKVSLLEELVMPHHEGGPVQVPVDSEHYQSDGGAQQDQQSWGPYISARKHKNMTTE